MRKLWVILLSSCIWIGCSNGQNGQNTEHKKDRQMMGKDAPSKNSKSNTSPQSYPGYQLVWSDEFNEKTLDTTFWSYQIGTGTEGWGNNELEYYTARPENSYLASGKLVIEAKKENYKGSKYTSARIITKKKRLFTYGRVDIRAKLPIGQGIWPALWMLGSNISDVGWPECGEIDIMELIGNHPRKVFGTLHWKKADGTATYLTKEDSLNSGDFSDDFHLFSLIRSKDSIKILLDHHPYYKVDITDVEKDFNPFRKPFFFIFNVAVGGNWPGYPDRSTTFPKRMYVDYIRMFEPNKS